MANIVHGKNVGLDGDKTSTGATCYASLTRSSVHGRYKLHLGDKTSYCPKCDKVGEIVGGNAHQTQDSISVAVDGAPVRCGCPAGINYLIAPGIITRSAIPVDQLNEINSAKNSSLNKINFQCSDDNGSLLKQHRYQLMFPDGHTEEGKTDDNGMTAWHFADSARGIHLNVFMEQSE
ncbi:PAAR domain-containing protein [Enterobacter cloacae complex sp. ESBL7]|uniref:PAAR domain-containing protein n=1 Tax=Enterobacter cloacae complex sp. ESBL7 TaxID=3163325 RepID=UPI003569B441